VTDARANGLTGNVLILFDPRQSSPDVLIPELLAIPFVSAAGTKSRAPEAIAISPAKPACAVGLIPVAASGPSHGVQPVAYVTGARRTLYRVLGWCSIGMAVVGAITPGIPTAPFVILAGYFFIRSSREAHEWVRQSRWFGPILRDWEDHRGVRRSVRNATLALIGGSMLLTAFLGLPLPLTITIWTLQVIGIAIVLRLHVVERPAPVAALVEAL
jgi:uncharacterized membrane protein YbaN (DUF454 family)